MKKILKISISTILYIILAVLALYLVTTVISFVRKKPVSLFGYGHAIVVSGSMEPTIETGSIIIIKNKKYEDVNLEDVIVYQSRDDKKNIVHRVIAIKDEGFITKGDNPKTNPLDDYQTQGYITKDRYIGTVSSYGMAAVGKILMNSRSLIIGLMVLFLLLLVIFQVISITKQLKEKEAEKQKEELKKYEEEIKEKMK